MTEKGESIVSKSEMVIPPSCKDGELEIQGSMKQECWCCLS